MITTTAYGKEIITVALGYAKGWREQNCKENNVDCYKYLFDNDYNKVIGNPWCAFFSTAVVNRAGDNIGLKCPIAFQGSSKAVVAFARKYGLRVDRTPAIGCLFWYPTGDATGHMGIPIWMNENGLYTVEGNSSDALMCNGCPKNAVAVLGSNTVRSYKSLQNKDTVYVHIEEFGNTPYVDVDNIFGKGVSTGQQAEQVLNAGITPFGALLLTSAVIGGIVYATS